MGECCSLSQLAIKDYKYSALPQPVPLYPTVSQATWCVCYLSSPRHIGEAESRGGLGERGNQPDFLTAD